MCNISSLVSTNQSAWQRAPTIISDIKNQEAHIIKSSARAQRIINPKQLIFIKEHMTSEPTGSAILEGNPFKVLASTASNANNVSVTAEDVSKDVTIPEVVPEEEEGGGALPEHAPPHEQAKDIDMMESQKTNASSLNHSITRDKDDTRAKPFVIAVAMTAALGGLIFGYDIGGAGATFVMDGFKEVSYHLSITEDLE
mmetsp:Transcript_7912/g.17818  ORF Transcript_7912/g.17818 Transcript_7912/m.17818 type:complete len:198 (-) Transcript_7912:1369-1962(-)